MSAEDRAELERVLREMEVTDEIDFDLDLKGAWPVKAYCKRTITVEGRTQTDERVYERL